LAGEKDFALLRMETMKLSHNSLRAALLIVWEVLLFLLVTPSFYDLAELKKFSQTRKQELGELDPFAKLEVSTVSALSSSATQSRLEEDEDNLDGGTAGVSFRVWNCIVCGGLCRMRCVRIC